MSQHTTLWETLSQKGLVSGQQPELNQVDTPWYVKSLLAFCGWLAALFILGFLVAAVNDLLDIAMGRLATGSLLLFGAWSILKIPQSDFLEHLALAGSLAGQCLIIYTFFQGMKMDDAAAWALVCLLQSVLIYLMPNFVHRVYSSVFAAFALLACFAEIHLLLIAEAIMLFVMAWVWLHEFQYPKNIDLMHPVGYGLVLALTLLKGTSVFHYGIVWWDAGSAVTVGASQVWAGEGLHALVLFYVTWMLWRKYDVKVTEPVVICSVVAEALLSLLSMNALGLTLGLLIILLGFFGSNRILQGIGITSLLVYVSSYYYLLETSLLDKSKTLLLIGVLLLTVRYSLKRLGVINNEQ